MSISRSDLLHFVAKNYCDIEFINIGTPLTKILEFFYNCECTDCGGCDITSSCKIEDEYYFHRAQSTVRITYV